MTGSLYLIDLDQQAVRSVIRMDGTNPVVVAGDPNDLPKCMNLTVTSPDGAILTPDDGEVWLKSLALRLRSYICANYVEDPTNG
jgi:hypothetical protein